jgi:hypothetical protein
MEGGVNRLVDFGEKMMIGECLAFFFPLAGVPFIDRFVLDSVAKFECIGALIRSDRANDLRLIFSAVLFDLNDW